MNNFVISFFSEQIKIFGRFVIFFLQSIYLIFRPGFKLKILIQQIEFVGVKSIFIIVMASIMVGAVFGIQFGHIFKMFGAESLIGAAATFALSKELAPVIGAFLVTGRAGSAITAEIATMKVNEQIDALQVSAVNPIGFLASHRILASMIVMPLLYGLFVIFGTLSAYTIGVIIYDIDVGVFLERIRWISQPVHIFQGIQKSIIFGCMFSSIACYKGFFAQGGAKGVGRSTTEAVVFSLVSILISDFFISYFQMSKVLL